MSCSLGSVVKKNGDVDVVETLYYLALSQNNRGDESTGFGFPTSDGLEILKDIKAPESVRIDALELQESMNKKFDRGLSHTRYSTKGVSDLTHSQPFHVKERNEVIVAHNGNIANMEELKDKNPEIECRTEGDTELIARIIANESSVREGLKKLERDGVGAFNLTIIDDEGTVYNYRDSKGFHPLWYVNNEKGMYSMSEDFAAYSLKLYDGINEVKPGELLAFDGGLEKKRIARKERSFCPFEVYYFENPGSTYQGKLIKDLRYAVGYEEGKKEKLEGDYLCVPVLSSGRYFGKGFSVSSGFQYYEGLIRNRTERIYMDPQERSVGEYDISREAKASHKHVSVPVEGKKIIFIDDSQVRGNTSKAITENAKKSGAEEVHWRFMFPAIKYPCLYGLDHSRRKNLIAAKHKNKEEIEEAIGADSVEFGTVETMDRILGQGLCHGCTEGDYPTRVPDETEENFSME